MERGLMEVSWSVHDEDGLWIEANDSEGMIVADAPPDCDRDEVASLFEHIVALHNESLLAKKEDA